MRFKSVDGRTIGSLSFNPSANPTIDGSFMVFDSIAHLLNTLDDHDKTTVCFRIEDMPEELATKFADRPIVFVMELDTMLDKTLLKITAKNAITARAPKFRLRRVGDVNRVYALNDDAQHILFQLMGNGARAIIKGCSEFNKEAGIEEFFVEPIARPAGRIPEEIYSVTFVVGEGTPTAYTDTITCSREELLEYIENPFYQNMRISRV